MSKRRPMVCLQRSCWIGWRNWGEIEGRYSAASLPLVLMLMELHLKLLICTIPASEVQNTHILYVATSLKRASYFEMSILDWKQHLTLERASYIENSILHWCCNVNMLKCALNLCPHLLNIQTYVQVLSMETHSGWVHHQKVGKPPRESHCLPDLCSSTTKDRRLFIPE